MCVQPWSVVHANPMVVEKISVPPISCHFLFASCQLLLDHLIEKQCVESALVLEMKAYFANPANYD